MTKIHTEMMVQDVNNPLEMFPESGRVPENRDQNAGP